MRITWPKLLASVLGVGLITAPLSLAGILYNPVVTVVGDGTAPATTGTGRTTSIYIYQNTTASQSSPVSSLSFNSGATGTRLITAYDSLSEGELTNNPGLIDAAAAGSSYAGTAYVFSAGYDDPNGTGNATDNIAGSTIAAPRVVGYMSVNNNTVSGATIGATQTEANAYNTSTGTIRSAVGNDAANAFWSGGTGGSGKTGWRYFTTNTELDTTNTNTRNVEIHNGQLFGSTGAGTHGIYAVAGAGIATTAGTSTLLFDSGSTSSGYEFVLINDPNNNASTTNSFGFDTAYIADDRTKVSGGGIEKFTWDGSVWSFAYTLTDGVAGNRGLAGQLDPTTGQVVLWTTNAAQTALEQVTDNGSAASSSFITLASVPAHDHFAGVALAPLPEPTFLGIAAVLFPLLAARRRRV